MRRTEAKKTDRPNIAGILKCLAENKSVRVDLPGGGRLHVDRKLPFLLLHVAGATPQPLALDVVSASASYALIADDPSCAGYHAELIGSLTAALTDEFGACLVIEVAEAERQRLQRKDAPILPEYEVSLFSGEDAFASQAASRIKAALESAEIYYRIPKVEIAREESVRLPSRRLGLLGTGPWLGILLPPVYFIPSTDDVYPELFEQLATTVVDALLQGLAEFCLAATPLKPAHHRALGRRAFIQAIRKVDRQLDEIARSFDFLLAVTPINSHEAWEEFRDSGFGQAPRFRYRPLPLSTDEAKRRLYALPLDHLEDPVLTKLFREKQHEIDRQLTMLQCRGTRRFKDAGRLLYGSVEPKLAAAAKEFLTATSHTRCSLSHGETVGCFALKAEAEAALAGYRALHAEFDATVEIRDDIPAGLMVSGPCLLISSQTAMMRARVDALLQHEIGVHLVTYFAGKAQGLALFRSGLAGYEGIQEGLGVFAEYAVGGLSLNRLRLLCARVVACAGMLDGAKFIDTFRLLTRELAFGQVGAFNIALRVHRSGGLSKDAIYLRGLIDVLALLGRGGSLEPFWFGKVAKSHLPVMAELEARGMLRPPPVKPAFLARADAQARIERARGGIALPQLIAA